ncbi:protein SON-like isoform X3 [Heptranchias perlo]|uniref:protein SON-like isoform X3 n=1 Tax=Heptranchias perlo TaxID=212740 RepID=UPI003559FDF6
MATNIEEIFRSFVVKKIKEIEDEKQQSGKVISEANGEIKPVVEPKVSEGVAGTTVDAQEEPIVNNIDHVSDFLDEQQSDNPDNKENMAVDSKTTEQIKCPASDNQEDSATPIRKSKKHKHKHHHKHKSKKKRKKKDEKKRDRSRSRSGSQSSLKSQSGLQLQSRSQSKSHSKSPLNNECSSRKKSKNPSLLVKSGTTGSNKNIFDEAADTSAVATVGFGKECSVAETKPLLQDNCNKNLHVKETRAADTNIDMECTTAENVSGLLAVTSPGEQNQESILGGHSRGSDNVQSKSTQTVEEKGKIDRTEARRTKRSRSRSHSKSTKHRKSQLHSHSHHSPVKKSSASSSSRHHASQSSCSRKRLSPARHRSKSTSREHKKHTESSPKSKRKQSRSRSIAKTEQRSKSKSRSPLRLHHRSRSHSIARTKRQSKSKSRHCSRSCSHSKHRSRTHSGSPLRSKSRVKRSHSPRPRSRSDDRRRHRSASRGYHSRLARTRRSPDWRRRSRSPLRRKSTSRTPERLTDLDKAQLLEIAKANAAAMCAKAGMPLPANLKPVVPLVKKEQITKKIGCSSIQELTEKCKKIVESNDDNELGNEPHVSEEDEPFNNQPIKVNELKPISFSLNNATVKPAAKTQVALTKEFPVSSGTQHRKKEVLNVYGEWVPVEKESEETTDDVFTDVCTQAVDISATMSERATAQKRLVENPYDVEAMSMILRAQEQIDVWAQSNSLPGQFTGSTGAQVLTYEELTNSGPQAWIRKFMFSGVSSSQTRDAVIQRESNWSPNQNCRYKSRTGPWATLAGVCMILCMVASFFCEVPGKTGEEGNGRSVPEGCTFNWRNGSTIDAENGMEGRRRTGKKQKWTSRTYSC